MSSYDSVKKGDDKTASTTFTANKPGRRHVYKTASFQSYG